MRFKTVKLASVLSFVASVALAASALSACAPDDAKVSNRNGFFGNSGGGISDSDAKFSDHITEYSRSMLIELADVARQTEATLQAVAATDPIAAPPATAEGPKTRLTPPGETPAALGVSACKVSLPVVSPAGTLKFETQIKGCKEKGPSFEGTQYGDETSFAVISKVEGQPSVATVIKVEGRRLETVLLPVKNPRDTVRVKGSRLLDAQLVSEQNGERIYSFHYETNALFSVDLKDMIDNGQIESSIDGLFIYSVKENKITGFRDVDDGGTMGLRVRSGRQARNGGKVVRQDFTGTAKAKELAMDLGACALPSGEVTSTFTVGPIGETKQFTLESKADFKSSPGELLNKARSKPASMTLCSADQQITMTEFYAGLFY